MKVVIFGAGKVGRGFLADLFSRAKWDITLVEVTPSTLDLLNNEGEWNLIRLKDEPEIITINATTIIDGNDQKAVDLAIQSADLLCTAIGGSHLENWAISAFKPLMQRVERGKIDIIFAENHAQPAELVRNTLQKQLSQLSDKQAEEKLFANLGLAQAQILRSCIEPSAEQITEYGKLTLRVQDHDILPLDADALTSPELLKGVPGIRPTHNFSLELTRKVFTYNAINAVVSYLGSIRKYDFLADAANDEEIALIAKASGLEASNALISSFGFVRDEQIAWAQRALVKYQDRRIVDPIDRQCRDPIRKLGVNDRLLGPILLAIKLGLPCANLAIGMAAALAYEPSEEEKKLDPTYAALSEMRQGSNSKIVATLCPNVSDVTKKALENVLAEGQKSLALFRWVQEAMAGVSS